MCDKALIRQEVENHIANDCPLTEIDCDFKQVGCEARLPRIVMDQHLTTSMAEHLSLQLAGHLKLIAKTDDLEKTLNERGVTASIEKERKEMDQKFVKFENYMSGRIAMQNKRNCNTCQGK